MQQNVPAAKHTFVGGELLFLRLLGCAIFGTFGLFYFFRFLFRLANLSGQKCQFEIVLVLDQHWAQSWVFRIL